MLARQLFCLALLVTSANIVLAQVDSRYVTQAELEAGYGLHWVNEWFQDIPLPKNAISSVAVSSDSRWIAYSENNELKVRSVVNGRTVLIARDGFGPLWHPSDPVLTFVQNGGTLWHLWDARVGTRYFLPSLPQGVSSLIAAWGGDGNIYFPDVRQPDASLRTLDRMMVDSSLVLGRAVIESVGLSPYAPVFPPRSMDYFVAPLFEREDDLILKGFSVRMILSSEQVRNVVIQIPDTTWQLD